MNLEIFSTDFRKILRQIYLKSFSTTTTTTTTTTTSTDTTTNYYYYYHHHYYYYYYYRTVEQTDTNKDIIYAAIPQPY